MKIPADNSAARSRGDRRHTISLALPRSALLALTALVLGACERGSEPASGPDGGPGATAPATTASEGTPSGAIYIDVAAARGLQFRHTDGSSGRYFIIETLASGVGLFDYNNDGRLDIYFVNGRMLPPGASPGGSVLSATEGNVLYEQQADGRFLDVTQRAGVPGTAFGVGCCAGDYDLDGDLDIYVTQYGPNCLYRNNGDGTFTDVTAQAGVGDDHFAAGAVFFDYDGDTHLDLYVTNYCIVDLATAAPRLHNNVPGYCAPSEYGADRDVLYRNNGDGTFTDVSEPSGIRHPEPGRGLGVVATDLDGDRDIDLYVANDGSENFLLINRGDGTFEESALLAGVALDVNGDEQGSMGVDIADFNLDGRMDIVVTNYQKQTNALYSMDESGFFTDISLESRMAGRSLPWVGWGTKFFDYDNDGDMDLFVANGHFDDNIHAFDQSSTYLQPNQLLANVGDGRFEDVSAKAGPGLEIQQSSRGAAFGDIDNDGDIDVVISNSRDTPNLLLNQTGNRNNWVGFRLVGRRDAFAIGARVIAHLGDRRALQEVRSGGSYVSQNDLRIHFGLGPRTAVEKVEITWPDGQEETLTGVEANRYWVVKQGQGLGEGTD